MEIKKDSKGRNLKPGENQMSDGRYRYRYVDKYGNRKAIYAWKLVTTDKTPKGKREDLSLREKIKNLSKDIDDGIRTCDSKITVSQMVEKYLSTKAGLATSTKNNYLHMLERNIRPTAFGQLQICKVKKSDVKKYYAYLFSQKKFKVGTIQLYQNLIFPSFQLAVEDDLIRKNPCNGCMKEYSRNSLSSNKIPLSRQQQKELLRFLQNDATYGNYFVLTAFILATGARIGEALGITWNDIDLVKKQVVFNHQLIYKKKDGKIKFYISKTKNGEERIVPLQNDIVEILKQYKSETYFLCQSSPFEVDGYKGFIFFNKYLKAHQPNTIVKAYHLMVSAHNKDIIDDDDPVVLPDFTPHTLRHTFCTRMAENGIDIRVLQYIMGHKTIEITMQVYNHVNNERNHKEVQKVSSALYAI